MNHHLTTLILQEIDDCDREAISKLRLISREFYGIYTNILPYHDPEDWSTLQGSGPVLSLYERFIDEYNSSRFGDLDYLTAYNIGQTLYRFRFIKEAIDLRGILADNGYPFRFESEILYPLMAKYGDYTLACDEILYNKENYIQLSKLIESFVQERDPRVKSLIRECKRVSRRYFIASYFNKNTLAHSDLELQDFLDIVKLIYTPLQMNVFAKELYLDYERPDLALCIANSNSKKYGGKLSRICWRSILATKAEAFLNFCSETGIRFDYIMNKDAFLEFLSRWREYSPSQKTLVREIINKCNEDYKIIIENAKEI